MSFSSPIASAPPTMQRVKDHASSAAQVALHARDTTRRFQPATLLPARSPHPFAQYPRRHLHTPTYYLTKDPHALAERGDSDDDHRFLTDCHGWCDHESHQQMAGRSGLPLTSQKKTRASPSCLFYCEIPNLDHRFSDFIIPCELGLRKRRSHAKPRRSAHRPGLGVIEVRPCASLLNHYLLLTNWKPRSLHEHLLSSL